MSQLGEELRQAREAQGISLAQAAVETRILQQSLVALEEGAFHRLPGDVVIRGFIRNYAQYLGLSAEELIEIYRRERGASDKIRVVPVTTLPSQQSYVLPSFLGIFLVTIALVGLTYVVLNAVGRLNNTSQDGVGRSGTITASPATPTALSTANLQLTVAAARSATPPVTTKIAGSSIPTASVVAAQQTPIPGGTPSSATPEAPIVVEVSIADDGEDISWLRIFTDNVKVYERIMRPGEREVFLANREFYIRAGNPPVVQVSVNGLQQGPLGVESGKPIDWYWPPR